VTVATHRPRPPAGSPEVAAAAAARLEGAPPQQVLAWALDTFGDRLAVAASMADAVTTHMAARIRPGVHVLFLDTGYHFAETLGTADAVEQVHDVTLRRMLPLLTVAEQDARYGARLHDRDPDLCCAMRKVEPLERALSDYDAWVSGIRRDEGGSRATVGVVEWDARRSMVKVNPLACWTEAQVEAYVAAEGVLVNPLLTDGYASVGCAPCTRRTAVGEGTRAGRWAGSTKTECGLHV